MMQCIALFSEIQNVEDLAEKLDVPVEEFKMVYAMATMMNDTALGILKDALRVLQALKSMGLFSLSQ